MIGLRRLVFGFGLGQEEEVPAGEETARDGQQGRAQLDWRRWCERKVGHGCTGGRGRGRKRRGTLDLCRRYTTAKQLYHQAPCAVSTELRALCVA